MPDLPELQPEVRERSGGTIPTSTASWTQWLRTEDRTTTDLPTPKFPVERIAVSQSLLRDWTTIPDYWWFVPPINYAVMEEEDWTFPELEEWARADGEVLNDVNDPGDAEPVQHHQAIPDVAGGPIGW